MQAEKDLAAKKSGLAEDESYLRNLQRDRHSTADQFEVEATEKARFHSVQDGSASAAPRTSR